MNAKVSDEIESTSCFKATDHMIHTAVSKPIICYPKQKVETRSPPDPDGDGIFVIGLDFGPKWCLVLSYNPVFLSC